MQPRRILILSTAVFVALTVLGSVAVAGNNPLPAKRVPRTVAPSLTPINHPKRIRAFDAPVSVIRTWSWKPAPRVAQPMKDDFERERSEAIKTLQDGEQASSL